MLIAFCGKAGAGKSTIGKMVSKQLGYKRYSMASPIKDFFRHLFMWDDEHLYGELKEVTLRTPFVTAADIVIAMNDTGIQLDAHKLVRGFQKVLEPFAVDRVLLEGYPAIQYLISPRKAMQLFGTDVCRTIHEDVWLDCAREAYRKSGNALVIDDIRFENEAQFVMSETGLLINITGRDSGIGSGHASEQFNAGEYADTSFDNSGDMKKAVAFVDRLCKNVIMLVDKGA